ncbi:MAG TPA: 1-deoxy-D-xylulose-5-phosphate synthase N-terminal domain-containing protein [Candidatus Magasanikbacteria bacterium]|nr:1-deoxy-D-xylulose-5-phosphate synthase N-terminal domain-containing protein [Candidatus Magasanikbacteria bacterium]
MSYQPINAEKIKELMVGEPERFFYQLNGGGYLNLQKLDLEDVEGINFEMMQKYTKIIRAMIFATLENSQNGHPGGSSSKVEQWLALTLTGLLAFDPLNPKNPGRDRLVWSAGHCTPLLYAGQALYYEVLRRTGRQFSQAVTKNVFFEDLARFRRIDGLSGHAESSIPYNDFSSGPSGHGFSVGGGMALVHKSCGLDTSVFVLMGDAESEEGMTYEARNMLASSGADNLIVSLDYNRFGLDGEIKEVISSDYVSHWLSLNWNVIEVDGHNIKELYYAYRLAKEKVFNNSLPIVVIAHTVKGKDYGPLENSELSHGKILSHEEYISVQNKLGFDISGEKDNAFVDLENILKTLTEEDEKYVLKILDLGVQKILPENKLVEKIKSKLSGRPFFSAINLKRPEQLPAELIFEPGSSVSTRQAFGAFAKWLMQNSAFVYAGAGDLSSSIMTSEAEKIYGIISAKNPYGRGLRFGIAENNMSMMMSGMAADILPGGFRPITVFGTYGVFLNMGVNSIRLSTINNAVHKENSGFFIAVSSHDGLDTGEDGPTHQGLDNLSIFKSMPGIKVFKPNDANETVEMLFYALENGDPIVLSLARPSFQVLKRESENQAKQACLGAYVFQDYKSNKKKKAILVVSGMKNLLNTQEVAIKLEKDGYATKLVVATSPELFAELLQNNPEKAEKIISEEERDIAITINNGYPEFLSEFLSGENLSQRMIGIKNYLKSGTMEEVYEYAGLSASGLYSKIKNILENYL